jgi:serine/threonine protein phosphatase PrpC
VSDEHASSAPDDRPVIDQDGQLDAGTLGLVAWITDVGHARKRNEDRLLVKRAFDGRFLLLLVADGAGGHNRGDKAATTVAETLNEVFASEGDPPEGPPAAWLTEVILASHQKVRDLAEGENRPPASTLVGLLVEEDTLCGWRFHVGDSRLYGRRTDEPTLSWTRDHNITNGLIDRGLPAAQAIKIAEGAKLTQVMGGGASPEPEIRGPFQLAGGDSFLICSDGIYGYNGDRDPLSPALDPSAGDSQERAQALKAAVLAGDALDNLTAVIWDVPADATPARKRLGLVEPYDRQDVSTMVNLTAHKGGANAIGPTGPPPPQSMPTMRSVAQEHVDRQLGVPTAADLAEAQRRLDEAREGRGASPGLKFGMLLMATLVVLAVFVWIRNRGDANAPMSVEQMEAERAQARALAGLPSDPPPPASETTEPLPVEAGGVEAAFVQLLAGFEPGWWANMPEERREERTRVLRDLLAPRAATAMELTWEVGEPPITRASSIPDWPAPGGANAEAAAAAWAARGLILGGDGELASQPGMEQALRIAACDQIRLRWPRGQDTTPGDAVQLPSWLGACLPPGADGSAVTVILGGYPDVGWTDDDWNELSTLAGSPGGAASIRKFDHATWNTRLVELGQLALALSNPQLRDVEVEVRVALDSSDTQVAAAERAGQVARVLKEGSGADLVVHAVGVVDAPVAEESEDLLPGQASKVAGLNRRLEVSLFRSSALDLDEEEEEAEAPQGK